MTLNSSGDLGIGKIPGSKLDVAGNINLDGSGRQIYFATGGAGLYWGSGYSRIVDDGDLRICTDDNLHFNTGNTSSLGTERMVLKANSDFGIGTGSLGFTLDVNGTDRVAGEQQWTGSGRTSHANYGFNREWYIRSGETSNDGKVIIQDGGGRVGVGTGSPLTTLHTCWRWFSS